MPGKTEASLYELFDELNLQYWERLTKSGSYPNSKQLAALVEANVGKPLPTWLNPLILKGLRGELKAKPGRPKKGMLDKIRFDVAVAEYQRLLQEMLVAPEEDAEVGKRSGREPNLEPPHQRAAKIAVETWRLRMDWRSFLNEISSEK